MDIPLKKKEHSRKDILFVVLAYGFLTILLTYPLIFHLTSHIPTNEKKETIPQAEPYLSLWLLWQYKHSLIDLHQDPSFVNFIFYPTGINLVFNTLGYFARILGIPLQIFGTLAFAYNIQILLSFFLTALGMYVLAFYFLNDKKSAFLAGVMFSFSAYHFTRALSGHLDLQILQFFPFFIFFLFRWHAKQQWKDVFFSAIFLFLNSITIFYYGLYALLFLGFFIIYFVLQKRFNRILWKQLGFMLSIFIILILPFIYPLLHEMSKTENYWSSNIPEYYIYSADLAAFFIPSPQHSFFIKTLEPFYGQNLVNGNEMESVVFLSYITIFFASIGLWKNREKREIRFFGWAAFFFFLLALGPVPHLFRKLINVPLPSLLLMHIPFFNALTEPARFAVMLSLLLTLLAAFGINTMLKKFKSNLSKLLFISGILLLIILENVTIPLQLIDLKVPPFYEKIKNESAEGVILEFPLVAFEMNSAALFYQTYHQKTLMNGLLHRIPPEVKIGMLGNPIVQYLQDYNYAQSSDRGQDIIDQDIKMIGFSAFSYYHIRWIILHKDWFGNYDKQNKKLWIPNASRYQAQRRLIEEIVGLPTYEDAEIVAYRIANWNITQPFLILGDGWHDVEFWDAGKPSRWMTTQGKLTIVAPHSMQRKLSFTTVALGYPYPVNFTLNNQTIAVYNITNWTHIITSSFSLNRGENTLTFDSQISCQIPKKVLKGSTDARCLTITVENMTLQQ